MFLLESISISVRRNSGVLNQESKFEEGMAPSAQWCWCECGFLIL